VRSAEGGVRSVAAVAIIDEPIRNAKTGG